MDDNGRRENRIVNKPDNPENPKVSIIITVFNLEKYIGKCIDSVLNQTYNNIELIIVNDGSNDKSLSICRWYKKHNPPIRLITQRNQGVSRARNIGIDHATGDFIYFVDGDDFLENSTIEKAMRTIKQFEANSCSFGMIKEYENSKEKELIGFKRRIIEIESEEDRMVKTLKYLMSYRMGWEVWNRIFQFNIIKKYNIRFVDRNVVMAEDFLFSFEYFLHTNRHVVIDELLYHYVQRDNSFTNTRKYIKDLQCINRLVECIENKCVLNNKALFVDNIEFIKYSILEWHIRDAAYKIGLSNALKGLSENKIQIKADFGNCIKYGKYDGYLSVILCAKEEEDIDAVINQLHLILNQVLQKIEIIVYCFKDIDKFCFDPRIKIKVSNDFDWISIFNKGVKDSFGEYLYFCRNDTKINEKFFAKYTDALKYNDCGICITGKDCQFLDTNDKVNYEMAKQFIQKSRIDELFINKELCGIDHVVADNEDLEEALLSKGVLLIE